MPFAARSSGPSDPRLLPAHEPSSAHRATVPTLDRATGLIEFARHSDADAAASLGAYLASHAVCLSMFDDDSKVHAITLLDVPDLNQVAIRIAEWQDQASPPPAVSVGSGWPGGVGRVHAVDLAAGVATIAAGDGFTIVDLMADRRLEVGDVVALDEPNGLGVAVYRNRTRGARFKVFVRAHDIRTSHRPVEFQAP
jgi:hypothetical protein